MGLPAGQIQRLFAHVDSWPPSHQPPVLALSGFLAKSLQDRNSYILTEGQAALFATAAVEIWQRSAHSLIVATALKEFSVIWACIAGYYSSHYAMRAYAHLFGYFALYYRRKLFLEISPYAGRFQCTRVTPLHNTAQKEHRFYWTMLKALPGFERDPLFTHNDDRIASSDAGHRGFASYADHLNRFGAYAALERERVKLSLGDLARTALDGEANISIPNRENYPQLSTVLTVAYLRVYRFREYLDGLLLPQGSRYWERHRNPPWCTNFLPFPPRVQ